MLEIRIALPLSKKPSAILDVTEKDLIETGLKIQEGINLKQGYTIERYSNHVDWIFELIIRFDWAEFIKENSPGVIRSVICSALGKWLFEKLTQHQKTNSTSQEPTITLNLDDKCYTVNQKQLEKLLEETILQKSEMG
jgi:hypothetical protein